MFASLIPWVTRYLGRFERAGVRSPSSGKPAKNSPVPRLLAVRGNSSNVLERETNDAGLELERGDRRG